MKDYYQILGVNKGASTNFSIYSYEELQSFSDIILENVNYGKILFNEVNCVLQLIISKFDS